MTQDLMCRDKLDILLSKPDVGAKLQSSGTQKHTWMLRFLDLVR